MRELSRVMRDFLYIVLVMVFGLAFANMSDSAVHYMGNPGDDFQNLREAFIGTNRMAGGDTLIIRDGIYEGNDNRIHQFMFPPMGAESNYTVIKAENSGKAIFTNGANISIINFPNNDPNNPLRYIQFEGIKWISTVSLYGVHHIKFFHCVFEGDVPEGNTMAFGVGYGSHHVLLEDCIAYGKGRYKFLVYRSSEIILRRCVGRQDYSNKNREVVPGGPIATFSTYSSWNIEFQNCIAIDGDQPEFWDSATELGGAFYAPISSDGFRRRGCIVLNMAMHGGNSSSSTDTHFEDSTIWDATTGAAGVTNGSVSHCTIGNLSETAVWGINCDIANNILVNSNYGISGTSLGGNVLYNNNNNGDVTPQDILDIDPLYHPINNPNGGLKYLVRTETDSNLSGKATDGGDPGCNILKRIGQSGTLWGEQGWNEVTDEDLWPWPYEEWVKENMGNYNRGGIDPDLPRGDSGFCAYISPFGSPNTLTSYIWEYLGNPIPAEIYEAVPLTITTTSLPDGTVNQAYSNALEAIGGNAPYTWSVISGSLPDGLALHSSSGLISGTPTTEGVSSFTIEVQDSGLPPDIAIKDLSIAIQLPANVPPELTPIGNKIVNEEELLQFTVTATDSDGDSLSLSCTNIPPGATFTDNGNGTGLFSWTPTHEQAGTYTNVHFEASDGKLADSEDIDITVSPTLTKPGKPQHVDD